jgi:hypothetical protein
VPAPADSGSRRTRLAQPVLFPSARTIHRRSDRLDSHADARIVDPATSWFSADEEIA